MMDRELWVIVPVYNEEASIAGVIEEWIPKLRDVVGKDRFVFCALNDGSKDRTSEILHKQKDKYSELRVIDKVNAGHGQTCIYGYKEALKNNAEWIFQIDSDGQCDPQFFKAIWDIKDNHCVIYGYRRKREDGFFRFLISRVVTLVVFATARIYVRDAHAPYRLMHQTTLKDLVDQIPADFKLANILVSVMLERQYGIKWVDIIFRDRRGGAPSIKAHSFIKEGIKLSRQLRRFRMSLNIKIKR